jgi:hypothetical protein
MSQLNYKIVDNFLNKEDFEKIKDFMLSSYFPWYFNGTVSYKKAKDGIYFTHQFFDVFPKSNLYYIVEPLLEKINPKSIIRVKGNLYPATLNIKEHGEHTDYEYSHKGLIFYINSNNGFTKLECGTKIKSIENRALFFNTSKKHNSTTCTDKEARVNININYF